MAGFLSVMGLLAFLWGDVADEPLRVVLVSGAEEYDSDRSLEIFKRYLEERQDAEVTLLKANGFDELPGLEALDDADVALFYTRRLRIDGEPLERVKRYAQSRKPLVGVRTASHGFQNWLEFDRIVYGGNYNGHYRQNVVSVVRIAPGAEGHPVLDGVGPLDSLGGLYRVSPLGEHTRPLLIGTAPEGVEPVAWTREVEGRRVVYTSLGAQSDFENPAFLKLLANALNWAAGRDKPRSE